MKPKERLLNAILGREVDHTPWSPFLAYWWEYLPLEIRNLGEVEVLQQMGADPLIRGVIPAKGDRPYEHLRAYDITRSNCTLTETVKDGRKDFVYSTKYGDLHGYYTLVNKTWFLQEHPVKTEEDFKILTYIMENTHLVPNHSYYDGVEAQYGDDILAIPQLTPLDKSGYQALIEFWVGTVDMAYAVADYEEVVEETLHAMWALSRQAAIISADSKAHMFLSWEDSSTTNYSPSQYRKYILPEIDQWCDILHSNGKYYVQHACGHLKDLLPIIAESKIDALESVSPPPTGNILLDDVREQLPQDKAIIGGVEPTFFLNSTMEELEMQVRHILEVMKGERYVLANSDSCPPGVEMEKFRRVSELVHSI